MGSILFSENIKKYTCIGFDIFLSQYFIKESYTNTLKNYCKPEYSISTNIFFVDVNKYSI